jgi:hypothetical protein
MPAGPSTRHHVTSPFSLVVTWQSYNAILASVGGSGVLLSSHETDSSVPRSLVCWNTWCTAFSARDEPLPVPQPARAATTRSAAIVIAFSIPTDNRPTTRAGPRPLAGLPGIAT